MKKKDLYEESLCNNRWTNNFYYGTQRMFASYDDPIGIPEAIISSRQWKPKVSSEHDKYRKANELTKQIPSLVAEVGTKSYIKRMPVLADPLNNKRSNEVITIMKPKNISQDIPYSSKLVNLEFTATIM